MARNYKVMNSTLSKVIDNILAVSGIDIPTEAGLSRKQARRRMRSFARLVAANGLRLEEASALLRRAGFETPSSPLSPSADFDGELAHRDGVTRATIAAAGDLPSLVVRFSPAAWSNPHQDFERALGAALGGPLRRLPEGGPNVRCYAAAVRGREIRLELAVSRRNGARIIVMAATAKADGPAPQTQAAATTRSVAPIKLGRASLV